MCAQPSILSITCHDLGRHLGSYGASVHSPNLDRLASEGVRFDSAFAVAPQCSPSRATLATGRYPHSNGVLGLAHGDFGWQLNKGEKHVAALLSQRGYECHLFGLQHVTYDVGSLGFHHRHAQGLAPEVCEDVGKFLEDVTNHKPLYVEVNLEEPHRPFDQGAVAGDGSLGVKIPSYLPDNAATRAEFVQLQGAIRNVDHNIGRVLTALDGTGRAPSTLVAFSSDHGIAMPRAKCTLYDPGIEIALILRWPGHIGSSQTIGELVSNIDVLPTLLEAAGVAVPNAIQGQSFFPLLAGRRHEARAAIYSEKTFHSYYDPMRSVRTERFKLIWNFESGHRVEVPADVQQGATFKSMTEVVSADGRPVEELYDLQGDQGEEHNLAGSLETMQVQGTLEASLLSWMQETSDPLLRGPIRSPAYDRALRRLMSGSPHD